MNETPENNPFKDAAERCDSYLVQYGVLAEWKLNPIGLMLQMEHGAERIRKYISWGELSDLRYVDGVLRSTEAHALKGLSS